MSAVRRDQLVSQAGMASAAHAGRWDQPDNQVHVGQMASRDLSDRRVHQAALVRLEHRESEEVLVLMERLDAPASRDPPGLLVQLESQASPANLVHLEKTVNRCVLLLFIVFSLS